MITDHQQLIELAWYKMPYGKYKGVFLSDIPEYYYVWFKRKGFPEGKLGHYMQAVMELKVNGIEQILKDIRRKDIKA